LKFWDTSAIVPLIVDEQSSADLRTTADDDRALTVWWATPVECTSAIARRERLDPSGSERALEAFAVLDGLAARWTEIPPTPRLRDEARRLVRVHDLRAADAFQLAAARVASDGRPETLSLVTLDERLALAARREGFPVLPA
jgi:uncharacterized protein